jgi:hypothetical protein
LEVVVAVDLCKESALPVTANLYEVTDFEGIFEVVVEVEVAYFIPEAEPVAE